MPTQLVSVLLVGIFWSVAASGFEGGPGSSLWMSPQLLPPGQTLMGLSFQAKHSTQRLNSSGSKVAIGEYSRQKQRGRNGQIVTREFRMEMNYERWTPTWAYGLMPGWTVMARLPFTRISSNIAQTLSGGSGDPNVLRSFDDTSGVHVPPKDGDFRSTRVGQFQIRSLHTLQKEAADPWQILISETLSFPTAERTRIDFLAFPDSQSEGFAAGLGLGARGTVGKEMGLNMHTQYTYRFEDEVYGRDLDGFPTDKKIRRQPGDEWMAKLGAEVWSSPGLGFTGGYLYQRRNAGEFIQSIEPLQASALAEKESLYLGLRFQSQGETLAYSSRPQFVAQLEWEGLLGGRNVEDADALNLELQVKF